MNRKNLLWISFVLLLGPASANAQIDEAPQEPPYVQDDSFLLEEDDFLSLEDNLESAPEQPLFPELQQEDQQELVLPEVQDQYEEEILFDEEPATEYAAPVEPDVVPELDFEPQEKIATESKPEPEPEAVYKNSRGRVEYIEHPLAAKGLMAITKDGSYIYRTHDSSKHTHTGAVRFGMMDPPKIVAADGTTFEMMYSDGQQPVIFFDYEWKPFSGLGKLGIQFSGGLLYANGNGRFADPSMGGVTPKEQYTFLAMPLSLGAVYRLEWMRRQWVAPYVSSGGAYVGVVEFRDDGKSPSMVGTPGAYAGGGMMFNVSAMGRDTAFILRSEYGISNLWVSVDYRYLNTFSEDVDFTSHIIGAGVVVDY